QATPSAATADGAENDTATSPATTSKPSDTTPAAPKHEALTADLPVKLGFSLDGASSDPVAVTLQLQSRTASWDATNSAWGDYGEWADVDGAKAELSADDLAVVKDADSQYTFKDLSIQTVTDAGAYEGRTQYRVVEAKVDGATLDYDSTADDGTMTYKASVSKDATDTTAASSVDYVVTVSKDAALLAETSDGTDAAKLAETDGFEGASIATAGTTEKTAEAQTTPAAAPMMLAPMATGDITVTFDANGGSGTMNSQTIANGTETALDKNTFTHDGDGYAFAGWNTATDGTGTPYADGAKVTFSVDTTLYAQWSKTYTYSVTNTTYNYADGDTTTYTFDKDVTVSVDGAAIARNVDGSYSIPQGKTAQVSFTSTSDALNVTMVPDADKGQTVIGSASVELKGTMTTAVFESQEPADNINLYKNWEDGALETKPDVSFSLQYSVDGGKSWSAVDAKSWGMLGYTKDTAPTVPDSHTGNATEWTLAFDKTLNEKTVKTVGDVAAGTSVVYRLAEASVPEGYTATYEGLLNNVLMNTKVDSYKAKKKWADGGNKYGSRPDIATWIGSIKCYKVVLNGTPEEVTLSSSDTAAEGYISVSDNGDGTWSISMPNALGYNDEDFPYAYYISESDSTSVATGANVESGTVYKPTYLNSGNYSSITSNLYDNGTATNTLTNTMTYNATKVWKDDGTDETKAARPTATLTLYRYPDVTGDSFENASPVSGVSSFSITDTTKLQDSITVTLPADTTTLPMFNEDGYKYVYFTKEALGTSTNGYAQVFPDGKNGTLSGNDRFLFNGGELDNTITGTVSLSGTKTWVAAAHQDMDAQVELTVTQTDPDTKKSIAYTTQTLTGFGAENTSQTADFAGLPEYNSNGHKYAYAVSETALRTKVGSDWVAATNKDGSPYFVTADGYRYQTSSTTDEKGNITITNKLLGNAQVTVNKTFTNGLLASPTKLTYTVYRNGTPIGTKTVSYTGTAYPEGDGPTFTPGAVTITKYEDMDPGSYGSNSGTLPRYDDSGNQYKYTVAETGVDPAVYGTTTTNSMGEGNYGGTVDTTDDFNGEKYLQATAAISNYKPGEGMSITVHKSWIDAGDQQYHEAVTTELQYTADGTSWTKVADGVIDTSTDYVYIGVPKTVPAGSTGTATYQDLYKTWVANGKPATGAGSFRVVETKLGSSAVVPDGDDSIKEFAGSSSHESGWSFVSGTNQNYDVSPTADVTGDYDFTVTNKRVGVSDITLTKTWVDGLNAQGTRPDSVTYTVTASEGVFTADATGKGYAYVDSTHVTYTATGGATDSSWSLTTDWFQKYDYTTGAIISYSIEETALNYNDAAKADNAKLYSKSSKHVSYVVGAKHTGDIDTYAYTNGLSDSVVPYMNKYWMDANDASAKAARPDIYPVLYRSTTVDGTTTVEKMTYQDRDWSTLHVKDFWWQCTFVSQPRYNAQGYEYTYYVGEQFSSSAGDYIEGGSGAWTTEPDADTGAYAEGADADKVTITYGDKTYNVAKLDNTSGKAGTIVNKPQAERTVSGTKVWANLPGAFNKAYLPDVTFQLYRCSYGLDYNDDKNLTKVEGDTATLKSGSSAFGFMDPIDATKALSVPRYDEYGKPYTYVVKETSPNNMTLAYTIEQNPANGLVITNSFKSEQNYGITFTKKWSGVPANTTVSTTLTLSRYLTDASGKVIEGTRDASFATAGTNGNENVVMANFKDATTANGVTSKDYGWSNLAYYGPNGNPYQYRVEETGIPNGYVIYDAAGTGKVSATKAAGATDYEAVVSPTIPETGTPTAGTAGLTNKYGEVLGSANVAKTWKDDTTYAISPRSAVTFKLWRTSKTETTPTQVGNSITLDGTVDVTETTAWKAAISSLEIYGPDGNAYSYFVTEGADSTAITSTAPTGYTLSAQTSTPIAAVADSTKANTTSLTNTVSKISLTATKKWAYNTTTTPTAAQLLFDMPLQAIPVSITYGFLYKLDGETTWNVLNDAKGVAFTKTITQSKGAFGDATLSDLPEYANDSSGTAKKVTYKAYEISVKYANGATSSRTTGNIDDAASIGDLSTSGSTPGGTTTVTNGITMRQIDLSKVWNDEYNRDGVRPSSITFTVTRTGVSNATDKATATIVLTRDAATGKVTASSNGATWDVTVSGDGNTWSTSVYVPTYRNDDTTQTLFSSYSVAETAITGYTTTAGATADSTGASPVSIGGSADNAAACFKNSRSHDTFTLNPAKTWSYNGVSYSGKTNLPDWLKGYLPSSITFTLKVSTDGSTWKLPSEMGADFTGIADTTKTTAIDAATGAITVTGWTSLPRYASDTTITNLVPYHYQITETLATEAQVFTATYSTSNFNAGDKTVTAGSTQTITATNAFDVSKLNITKNWADSSNAYSTRPDAVKYLVEYSADGTTWKAVPAAWMASSASTNVTVGADGTGFVTVGKAFSTADTYTLALNELPKYAIGGTSTYQYRATEKTLTYGTNEREPGASASDAKLYYLTTTPTTSSTTDNVTTFTSTSTNTLNTTSFNMTKTWVPTNSSAVSITVKLQETTKETPAEADWSDVIDSAGTTKTWTIAKGTDAYSWSDLPKFDASGNAYHYRAVETAVKLTGSSDPVAMTYGATKTSGEAGGYVYTSTTTGTTTAITNTATNVSLVKKDATDTTKQLPGAVYTLAGTFADGTASKTFTSSSTVAAAIAAQMLADNTTTYTLSETTPAPGYKANALTDSYSVATITSGAMTLKMDMSGKLWYASSAEGGWTAVDSNALVMKDAQNALTITKQAGGVNLGGATFELSTVGGDKFATATSPITWTTSATDPASNPHAITGEFVAGSVYKLSETTPAPGYTVAADVYLKMDAAGSLSSCSTKDGTFVAVTSNALVVTDTQSSLSIEKMDQFGADVAGATLQLAGMFANDTATSITWTTSATAPTNNPYILTGKLIANNEYTLSETTTPADHVTAASAVIRMTNTGQLQVRSGSVEPYTWTAVDKNAFKLVDTLSRTQASITKTDANKVALAGCTFSLYKQKGAKPDAKADTRIYDACTPVIANGTAVWSTATAADAVTNPDTNQKLNLGLADGTYYFVETACPPTYHLDSTPHVFTTTVDTNGTTVDTTVANESLNAGMTLTKLDATSGAALTTKATTFTLAGPTAFNSGKPMTLITDADGTISVSNLPKGKYTLTETGTDANYTNGNFAATFSVTDACKDQTLVINSASLGTATPFGLTVTVDSDDLVAGGLQNVRKTGSVSIQKLGVGDDAAGLGVVTFKLYQQLGTEPAPKTDTVFATGVTANGTAGTTKGALSFTNLPWGNYYLVETAVPAGYQVDATPHAFTIGAGSLTKSFTDTSAIQNTKNTFTLVKKDADGNALEGATFTITGVFSDSAAEVTKTITAQSTTWTGVLIGGNTYTVKETTPPTDYKDVADFAVTMGYDGTLTAASGTELPSGVSIEANNTLTVKDTLDGFTVTKIGQNGQPLAGTAFSLQENATSKVIDSWTIASSDPTENPRTITGKMVVETLYKLVETAAAPGYTVASPIYLKMDDAGNLYEGSSADAVTTAVASNKLEVSDTLATASFTKLDSDGKTQLDDAQFKLYGTFAANGTTGDSSITWDSSSTAATQIAGQMIEGYTYTLAETAPAPGHVISSWSDSYPAAMLGSKGELVLKINEAGQLQYKTGADTWADVAGNAVAMRDAPNDFTLSKVDSQSNVLTGSKFTITGTFAGGKDSETRTFHSDSVSEFKGQLVAGSTYTIAEATPPFGYTAVPNFDVKVSDDGASISLADTTRTDVSISNGAQVVVTDVQNSASFSKVESDGTTVLEGAQFSLTGYFASDVMESSSKTWTSAASAKTVTGEMIANYKYTLAETAPADGYVISSWLDTYPDAALDQNPATYEKHDGGLIVMMDSAGQLWYQTSDPTVYASWKKVDGNSVAMKDSQVNVSFSKTDRTTGKQLASHTQCIFKVTAVSDGTFLDGKTEVTGYDDQLTDALRGQLVATVGTADANGNFTATGTEHIYQIQEIQEPVGYQIEPKAVQFIVSQAGDVYVLSEAGGTVTSANGTVDLNFSDPKIAASIVKADASGAKLAGATFELDGTFVADDGISTTTTPITWTSTASAPTGVADGLLDGKLVSGNAYTLKETSAPSGYDAISGTVAFTVDAVGKITLTSDANGAATVSGSASDAGGMVITVADAATAVPVEPVTPLVSAVTPKTGDATSGWLLPLAVLG
ncbi:MAG: SpaA isopeptide-forming pilin-related protein, partial [Atopobiaceae bacterium]